MYSCRLSLASASESQPILIRRKRPLGLSRPKFLCRLRMCQSAAMRHGTRSKTSGVLLAFGIGSYAKVAHIDPGCEEALHALFGLLFNVADIIDDFCW